MMLLILTQIMLIAGQAAFRVFDSWTMINIMVLFAFVGTWRYVRGSGE